MAQADRVRRIYDRRAADYDAVARRPLLEGLRARLFAEARGEVLELGVGTGATLPHYGAAVTGLTALDVSEGMLERARPRAAGLGFPVRFLVQDFQTLPFPDAGFDTATASLALCGVPEPARLFAEVRRVLRPGGRLLALEHVRPPNPLLGLATDLANPLWDRAVGCDLNRPTPALLAAAGFRVRVLERRLAGAVVALAAEPY